MHKLEEIISYIEEKKEERNKFLSSVEMCLDEMNNQNSMLFGVDMVIRWIKEMK